MTLHEEPDIHAAWPLRRHMAEQGLRHPSYLVPLLAHRGVSVSVERLDDVLDEVVDDLESPLREVLLELFGVGARPEPDAAGEPAPHPERHST
ncbi:hypothetical protein [Nocardioides daeguensis]|uniref:Uncharacterized protein n=1 Tax=Nocardioides daeguensis TaxID=908359 RepID=A0ABP6WB73_9ACTN|nr:hypothetical protein [Nocardioides daeguensis]MBV6729765.1 hypothetical protein [Nocardioides daeguensis]MCR1773579.1 hypothetical protein [Nocardioides daeguensis]